MQADFAAGVLLDGIYDAGVERARVKVQAHRALTELARIAHIVNWVQGINRDWMGRSDFHHVGRNDVAVLSGQVFLEHSVVVHRQSTHGGRHPAVLSLVIVDGGAHADLPADGQQLVEVGLVDEVAGVMLGVPHEKRLERLFVNRIGAEDFQRSWDGKKIALLEFLQIVYKLLNRDFAHVRRGGLNRIQSVPPCSGTADYAVPTAPRMMA